jgi:hypothetical protein
VGVRLDTVVSVVRSQVWDAADGPGEEDRRQNHGGAEGDGIRSPVSFRSRWLAWYSKARHGAHQVGGGPGAHEVRLGASGGGAYGSLRRGIRGTHLLFSTSRGRLSR